MLVGDTGNDRVQIFDLSPTVAITSDASNGGTHNSDTISYTATFSEDVTGFVASDIAVSGTASGGTPTVSDFTGTGTTYTFEVTATSGDTVTVSIPQLAASDAGHNFNRASDEYTITVTTPSEPITATITNTSTPNGGTHTSTYISYTVTFNKPVMDFTRTDIKVSGTASITPEGVQNFNESGDDGLIWTFSLDATSDGTLKVSIPQNAVIGVGGGGNMASNTYTVTLDIFVPVATFQSSIEHFGGDFINNRGVAVNSAHILVADTHNHRIQIFDLDGNFVRTLGSSYGSDDGQFKLPYDITVTPTHILVADSVNDRIQILDLDGNYVDKFGEYGSGNGMFISTTGIATTPTHILVADWYNHRIQIFDLDGNYLSEFGSPGSGNGQFDFPAGVTTTPAHILVADRGNHRIQIFDLDGNYLNEFGSYGSGNGQFSLPEKVTTTPAYILVADANNNRIQVHDWDGNYISTIGSHGTGNDQFDRPSGITTNSTHMLVGDTGNHRIQIFDLSPTVAITSDTPNGGTHNSNTISYTATFSEDVTGFVVSDITVSGTASGGTPTVSNFAGNGTTYTFEVAVTSGDTVTVSIPKLAASDTGHNFNMASDEYTVTVPVGPSLVIMAPDNQIFEATAVLTPLTESDYGTATVVDNSGTALITNDAPGSFPLGETTITWSATDASGNTVTATQIITIEDTTPPDITAPADVTAEATGTLTVVPIGMATATDNYDPNPVITNNATESFPTGDTLVTWTATDSLGNQASATQTITITPPETITATITNTSTPNGGTHTSTDISYTVTFNKPVTGFTRTDIIVSGTASVTPEEVQNFNESGDDGLIWTFSLDATSDGTLKVSIPRGAVMGADGSVNMASNTYTVTLDIIVPVATFQSSIDRLAGEFQANRGIAVNSTHILVADTGNDRIRVFDLDGNFVSTFGSGGSADGQFKSPRDIAVTPMHILVADTRNDRIQIFDLDGNYVDKFGERGSGDGMFITPIGVTTTPTHILVADTHNHRIQIFDLDGNYLNEFGGHGSDNGQFTYSAGVTTTPTHILVADRNNHRIQIFDLDGNYVDKFGGLGSGNGQFKHPSGVATTPAYILVADRNNHRIQVHDWDGNYISTIGSRGSGNDQFNTPRAITTNSTHMLVGDSSNHRVQIFDLSPTVAITSDAPNDGTYNSNTISYTATFSEDVTDFVASDITVFGTVSGGTPTVSNFAGSGTTYTFEVAVTSDGIVTVFVPKLAASDAGHNFNRASDEYSVIAAPVRQN